MSEGICEASRTKAVGSKRGATALRIAFSRRRGGPGEGGAQQNTDLAGQRAHHDAMQSSHKTVMIEAASHNVRGVEAVVHREGRQNRVPHTCNRAANALSALVTRKSAGRAERERRIRI